MSIQEITTVLTGVATATKFAKSLIDKVQDKKLREELGSLQDVLLQLQNDFLQSQSGHAEIITENEILKEKLTQLEEWEAIKSNYELREIAGSPRANRILN